MPILAGSPVEPAPPIVKIFGREPAVYIGLVNAAIALLLAVHVLKITPEQAGLLVAVTTAALGVYTAMVVKDSLLSAAVTLSKVAIALAVSFGLALSTDQIGVVMTFVTLVLSFFLRTQTSPIVDDFAEPAAG